MNNDIYEYIIKNADDRTVIMMMIANPKLYRDDQVWKRIVYYKYPLLMNFKNETETWKTFLLSTIETIALLKEKFNFPYIPTKSFDPRSFYKKSVKELHRTRLWRSTTKFNIWESGMVYAIESENNLWINLMIKNGANNFNEIMKRHLGDYGYNFAKKMGE